MSSSRRTSQTSNLSSARKQRQAWRQRQSKRTHQQLYDASDYLRTVEVNASGFARLWIGVGLQIAADILNEMAAEILVEDIIKGEDDDTVGNNQKDV